jgi:ADP-ribosyl-[dinitrogen reductase] hydrolase
MELIVHRFASGIAKEETISLTLKQAVNLGNDADTTAAIFGQIAGPYYGIKGIPRSWVDRVFHLEQLIDLANNLLNSKL